ncbi:MAG: DUF1330 domain-containing protein [Methyloligellaceae bacterium]
MSVFIIGHIKILNEAKYRIYEAQLPEILHRFGARVLAVDPSPRVLEGHWPFDEVVLIEFYDTNHAKQTLTDPTYLNILQERIEGAEVVGLLVQGMQ